MAETRLNLEPEVQKIFQYIDEKHNFLLSGGAGSGKTYSLVQVIRQVIQENPSAKVACMTYTNAAVKQIEERVNHKNLNVTTIHDFLWDNIKHFQRELKLSLIALVNNKEVTAIKIDDEETIPDNYFDSCKDGIQYKEYLRIREGIISHDELLIIANHVFATYPLLCDIVKDKYKFIFIDEYQDTSKDVVEIFLSHFKKSKKHNIIGFFGDAMQSIYDDSIGNLNDYKGDEQDKVREIKKEQNRRNPQSVIKLANRLRTDGLVQIPSDNNNAPNMLNGQVKPGSVLFIYSSDPNIAKAKQYLLENYSWNFSDIKETKELNLTHNLIADKAGFRTIMDIYDKDLVLNYRDRIKKYIKDKGIETDFLEYTFEEVIESLKRGKTEKEQKSILPTKSMQEFIDSHVELYNIASNYNYGLFSKIYISRDQLLDDKKQEEDDESKKGSKRDNLIRHLFKIQNNISLYQNGQYNEFLRLTDFRHKITSITDKKVLKENIENLIKVGDKSIETIITDAHVKGICLIDDRLMKFQKENEYLYNRVKSVKFSEFQKLYDYLEGKTPFSTQHKTKGDEYNNVLVVLDNGGWNNYNFKNLFLNDGTDSVLERTQKIFYVCCTRAKENLAVFYHAPKNEIVHRAIDWFGSENVVRLP